MDSKKTMSASRPAARTPQPPPPVNTTAGASSATKPRSRSSTPTAPTVSALAGSRSSNGSSCQPKAKSNNNSGSPRVGGSSGNKPTPDEPATEDDESSDRFGDSSHAEWMRQSEETLAVLEKQVQDATKRNLKHQTRCATMRDSIAGKEERMDTLQGTYASLNRELVELEALSSGDYDSDTLEAMFMSIPADERVVPITNAE